MSRDQILVLAILAGMLGLFLWDRLRYDVIGLSALIAGVACGVIPTARAFSGFSNDVIPLIAGALVVSAAIGRSGAIDAGLALIVPYLRSPSAQVAVLAAAVALLSAFLKNVGALAIFLPVALQVAAHHRRAPSELLMPLSFASLIGGSMTLIGTSPNILVSGLRLQLEGRPFGMFAFMPVGAGVLVAGLAFLAFGWRLLPQRRAPAPPDQQFRIEDYAAEVRVAPGSPMIGKTVEDLEAVVPLGDIAVAAIIRNGGRRRLPRRGVRLEENDVLLVESDPQTLKKLVDASRLELVGSTPHDEKALDAEEIGSVEAVVTPESDMVGASPASLRLSGRHGLNLLALSRSGERLRTRLQQVRFKSGDVVVLQGRLDTMPETLSALGVLPLAARNIELGRPRRAVLPLLILASAVALTALEIVPAAIAFVAAALAVALLRILTLREVYQSIEWPILVLIGSLIPVGEAVRQTGVTDLVATRLYDLAAPLPGVGAVAVVMMATMLMTPLVHHAAAVIIMGPIAASVATRLGLHIDPFLMAVAIGANSDFLTPIGHQNNTLVLGPAGYRFGDYWRLGLPLSLIVVAIGTGLIALVWPLR